jgi:Na+/H+ antiporter NhaA
VAQTRLKPGELRDRRQARLPLLSAYLGHKRPAHTYWYFTAVPELTGWAASRMIPITEALP